jgi:hypothetical protein
MIRRDHFIKSVAKINSGDYIKNKVVELEKFVDAELAKHENILSLINSNTQGEKNGNIEIVQTVEETYAVHSDPTVLGDDGEVNGRKIWNDYMFYPNGGFATNEPWESITLTNDTQFDGALKVELPADTNKNVAKLLADKYMDTTIVAGEPLGGCWGSGNVIVTLDNTSNKLYMTFKIYPMPTAFMPTYFATATYTATCPTGKYGNPVIVTVTKSSKTSYAEADALAQAAAEAQATSQLVCTDTEDGMYYSTKTVTVNCPSGQEGDSKTATATASGTTQEEADANATQKATDDANAQLVCRDVWTSEKTVTVYCPEGTTGSPSTATGYGKSYVNQADADRIATENATTTANQNLTCTSDTCTPNWQPVYESGGCFSGTMRDTNGCEADRPATHTEWEAYQVPTDNNGYQCMLLN